MQPVDPLWRSPDTDSEAQLAERLGGGAQGDIHAIEDNPTRVFQKLSVPAFGAPEEFDRLVGIGHSVHAGLRDAAVDLVWPETAACEGDAVTGYTMPRLPSGYLVRIKGKEPESALMYAVAKGGPFAPDIVSDSHQRLALITGVARFLDMLHSHDYVHGHISWSNILFRLDPEPTVLVFDIDGARAVGRGPALAPRRSTPSTSSTMPLLLVSRRASTVTASSSRGSPTGCWSASQSPRRFLDRQ